MRPWKAVLGVGAACAVCCAVPLLGGVAGLAAGTTAVGAAGSALLACADELTLLGFALLAVAAASAGLVWWRRRAHRKAQVTTSCGGACNASR